MVNDNHNNSVGSQRKLDRQRSRYSTGPLVKTLSMDSLDDFGDDISELSDIGSEAGLTAPMSEGSNRSNCNREGEDDDIPIFRAEEAFIDSDDNDDNDTDKAPLFSRLRNSMKGSADWFTSASNSLRNLSISNAQTPQPKTNNKSKFEADENGIFQFREGKFLLAKNPQTDEVIAVKVYD